MTVQFASDFLLWRLACVVDIAYCVKSILRIVSSQGAHCKAIATVALVIIARVFLTPILSKFFRVHLQLIIIHGLSPHLVGQT